MKDEHIIVEAHKYTVQVLTIFQGSGLTYSELLDLLIDNPLELIEELKKWKTKSY